MDDNAGERFLDDVRVLEIASLAPTQLGMHLADLGAEVIKIEPPARGDATRLIGKRPELSDSGIHRRWNRGKKSVAVDTSTPAGADVVRRLVPYVDIVIEGLRPGTLQKMGLGWSDLTALKSNLVMVALSGYGQTGPYRDMPSHGLGFDAIAGLAGVEDDDEGRPRVPSRHVYYGPLVAPLIGASAALAALSWSRRTGKPVFLDIAQADAAAFANFDVEMAAGGLPTIESSDTTPSGAPAPRPTMQTYRTRDGQVLLLMALERKFFVRLVDAVGRPDLLRHFPEDQYLVQGNQEVDDAMVEIIASRDLGDWMELFAGVDVPVVPVYESARVSSDPHLRTRIVWLEADDGMVTMKSPVRSDPAIASPTPAPAIGQDTTDVLIAFGFEQDEIERMADEGIVRIASER